MPHSHHSHSGQFCRHALGSLEEVVLEAIKQRFEVYGLTEHVPRYRLKDLYPEERELSLDDLTNQFMRFLNEAHRLKEVYSPQITLLVGLETEYITDDDLNHLRKLLKDNKRRIDYIVGSVHHVSSIPIDFDRVTYEKALANFSGEEGIYILGNDQMERFLSAYFDAQHQLIRQFQPEIVGHLDLCRLYTPSLDLKQNIEEATRYGALFEINAAALKKEGWASPYPGKDVVALIQEKNGRFALSDDSHGPQTVGQYYLDVADYLVHVGITELWCLGHSSEPNHNGRYISPRRTEGDWRLHAFWTHREGERRGIAFQ
ncbi:Polymerase/histidinol phosphatase-like protein [Suillus clintonianus]|uniref:Polymerase/histidinol phosphatase-like protein n=1 Tax=Suillus clintonianus TaxID=1904413 RepID=UPI001B86A3D5|nr:Polymerase/histidinol phosphatase-like protein [Suillus clintonianus]KAG2131033.1 Polymerase/histidinol phosphatase-like protein [Suillus clintonianus]